MRSNSSVTTPANTSRLLSEFSKHNWLLSKYGLSEQGGDAGVRTDKNRDFGTATSVGDKWTESKNTQGMAMPTPAARHATSRMNCDDTTTITFGDNSSHRNDGNSSMNDRDSSHCKSRRAAEESDARADTVHLSNTALGHSKLISRDNANNASTAVSMTTASCTGYDGRDPDGTCESGASFRSGCPQEITSLGEFLSIYAINLISLYPDNRLCLKAFRFELMSKTVRLPARENTTLSMKTIAAACK